GHDVEQHVRGQLEAVRRHPGPVDRELLVRRGVDHPADTLDRLRDVLRSGTAAGALEEEVLDEVRGAADAVVLESRTDRQHRDEADRGASGELSREELRPSLQYVAAVCGGCAHAWPV